MRPYQVLRLRATVDLVAMAIKDYPHSPTPQQYWSLTIRLFCFINRTLFGRILPLCRGAVSVFYNSIQLGRVIGCFLLMAFIFLPLFLFPTSFHYQHGTFFYSKFNTYILFVYYPHLPTPPLGQDMTRGQFLSGV